MLRKIVGILTFSVILFANTIKSDAKFYENGRTITVCFAGDCTLGIDENFGYYGSFNEMYDKNNDLGYFLSGVAPIFKAANFTAVNLETTLTDATSRVEKQFNFKGYAEFAKILKIGGVGAVNLANNHTYDYGDKGFTDTIAALEKYKVPYFGLGYDYIATVKGVKLGFLGYKGWSSDSSVTKKIETDVAALRERGAALVFVYFHWGIEGDFYPNSTQKELGRRAIDAGADLVWASHQHVIQGIEKYNDKYIAYGLGNFCYGGHKNPSDKDAFILRFSANVGKDGAVLSQSVAILPCVISSVKTRNDYQPTLAAGEDFERVKTRLTEYSLPLGFEIPEGTFLNADGD